MDKIEQRHISRFVDIKSVATRYGQRVVFSAEFSEAPKQKFWASIKQGAKAKKLQEKLEEVEKGYSTKKSQVIGFFKKNDKGELQFVWAAMMGEKWGEEYQKCCDKFGVEPYDIIVSPKADMEVGENYEADKSLLDE